MQNIMLNNRYFKLGNSASIHSLIRTYGAYTLYNIPNPDLQTKAFSVISYFNVQEMTCERTTTWTLLFLIGVILNISCALPMSFFYIPSTFLSIPFPFLIYFFFSAIILHEFAFYQYTPS